MPNLQLIGVPGIPLVETGDDLLTLILTALDEGQIQLEDGDVLVITSKVVSKAEGRWVDLTTMQPDEEAQRVAAITGKDPQEVALILQESNRISRMRSGVLIVEQKLGIICANAGIDHSNTREGGQWRLLLPENPDATAHTYRERIKRERGAQVAIIISDSQGRPFRMGTVGIAIGAAGLPALWDWRGTLDLFGTPLHATEVGFADEIAAAAGLIMGQTAESLPVVIVRGLRYPQPPEAKASDLIRPKHLDLYG